MNNHMSLKLVGANSSLELNSPITSIYLQEELTGLTTLPGIRETKGMNIGMDGGWTSAQFYEPRLITVKGVIANQDVAVVEQRRKQLIQLLAEKRLALEFQTEAGNHYTMNVVVAGVQMPLSKVLTASYFQINLRADDPLIYDNNALAELEAILRRSSSASSGFTINFPINFQLGTSESRPTIDNFGSSVIYPVITLTGPLTTPEIVNITTNMAFTIDEVLGAGTYTASGIRGAMNQEGSVDTYSGNPIQATRDAESPISTFSLYGDATQQTYSGKNLINMLNPYRLDGGFYNLAVGTQILPSQDGTSTITQTSTGVFGITLGAGWRGAIYVVELPVGTDYYLSGTITSTANRISRYALDENHNITRQLGNLTGSPAQQTLTVQLQSGEKYFALAIGSNSQITIATTNIMLEKGNSASAYEPYVGGTASPNPDYPQAVNTVTGEQAVKIEGKNLCYNANRVSATSLEFFANCSSITGATATLSFITDYATGGNASIYAFVDGVDLHTTVGYIATTANQRSSATVDFANIMSQIRTGSVLRLLIYRGGSAFTSVSDAQLELGSTATTYEPYQAQTLPVNLGKNLFDTDTAVTRFENIGGSQMNDWGTYQDGIVTIKSNGAHGTCAFAGFKPTLIEGETYTLSATIRLSGTNATNQIRFGMVQNSPNMAVSGKDVWLDVSKTFVATATDVSDSRVDIQAANTGNIIEIKNIQLEKGSATTYAPYFTPIELAKIGNYQDRIYKEDGKWYIEKQVGKVVLDGTETWTLNESGTGYVRFTTTISDIITSFSNTTKYTLSDHFVSSTQTETVNANADANRVCVVSNGRLLFKTLDTSLNTVAKWQTWLASNPTTVYYALATPTTTEITSEALIDQLDAILEAHLYEGINNISNVTISPNLSGDLEIKTGQTLAVINSLSIVGSSGSAEIGLGESELAMVGSVADELTINGTTGAVTKTTRIGKIASYAGETITTDYISTSGGLDSDATIYYVLPSSSTSVINTLDSTALAAFNCVVASGGVSAQTNIGSISVDVTTVTAQDVAVVDTKQHTVTINGVGAYSKFSGDWLTLDVGLNELQLITENNTDTGSAVIKYRVGYMGV